MQKFFTLSSTAPTFLVFRERTNEYRFRNRNFIVSRRRMERQKKKQRGMKELSTCRECAEIIFSREFSTVSAVNGTTCIMLYFPLFKALNSRNEEEKKSQIFHIFLCFFLLPPFPPFTLSSINPKREKSAQTAWFFIIML